MVLAALLISPCQLLELFPSCPTKAVSSTLALSVFSVSLMFAVSLQLRSSIESSRRKHANCCSLWQAT